MKLHYWKNSNTKKSPYTVNAICGREVSVYHIVNDNNTCDSSSTRNNVSTHVHYSKICGNCRIVKRLLEGK